MFFPAGQLHVRHVFSSAREHLVQSDQKQSTCSGWQYFLLFCELHHHLGFELFLTLPVGNSQIVCTILSINICVRKHGVSYSII